MVRILAAVICDADALRVFEGSWRTSQYRATFEFELLSDGTCRLQAGEDSALLHRCAKTGFIIAALPGRTWRFRHQGNHILGNRQFPHLRHEVATFSEAHIFTQVHTNAEVFEGSWCTPEFRRTFEFKPLSNGRCQLSAAGTTVPLTTCHESGEEWGVAHLPGRTWRFHHSGSQLVGHRRADGQTEWSKEHVFTDIVILNSETAPKAPTVSEKLESTEANETEALARADVEAKVKELFQSVKVQASQLQSGCDSFREQLVESKGTEALARADVEAKVKELFQSVKVQASQLQSDCDSLREQLVESKGTEALARADVEAEVKELFQSVKVQASQLHSDCDSLREQLVESKGAAENAASMISQLQEERKSLQEQVDAAKAQVQDAEQIREELAKEKRDGKKWRETILSEQERSTELQEQLAAASKELYASQRNEAAKTRQAEKLQKQLEEAM